MENIESFYQGKRAIITGGLGMIGSSIARRLVRLGAEVLLVDNYLPPYGANLVNIAKTATNNQIEFNSNTINCKNPVVKNQSEKAGFFL